MDYNFGLRNVYKRILLTEKYVPDFERDLAALLSQQLAKEIDKEIMNELLKNLNADEGVVKKMG